MIAKQHLIVAMNDLVRFKPNFAGALVYISRIDSAPQYTQTLTHLISTLPSLPDFHLNFSPSTDTSAVHSGTNQCSNPLLSLTGGILCPADILGHIGPFEKCWADYALQIHLGIFASLRDYYGHLRPSLFLVAPFDSRSIP